MTKSKEFHLLSQTIPPKTLWRIKLFLIKEKSTGMVLFMGKVTNLDWIEMDKQNSPHGNPVSE